MIEIMLNPKWEKKEEKHIWKVVYEKLLENNLRNWCTAN